MTDAPKPGETRRWTLELCNGTHAGAPGRLRFCDMIGKGEHSPHTVEVVPAAALEAAERELQDDTVSARKRIEDLCNENTALAAKLEQAERERDEAQKYAELRDRQVTIINEKAQTDIARLTRELEEMKAYQIEEWKKSDTLTLALREVVEAARVLHGATVRGNTSLLEQPDWVAITSDKYHALNAALAKLEEGKP